MIVYRTVVALTFIVIYACGQSSDGVVKEAATSDNRPSIQSTVHQDMEAKHGIKVGSSGFNEFKGNIPLDKSYRPSYVPSVNIGSFGGNSLRSSSVLREAQLHSAASRAEMTAGMGGFILKVCLKPLFSFVLLIAWISIHFSIKSAKVVLGRKPKLVVTHRLRLPS